MEEYGIKDFKGIDTTPTEAFKKIVNVLSN